MLAVPLKELVEDGPVHACAAGLTQETLAEGRDMGRVCSSADMLQAHAADVPDGSQILAELDCRDLPLPRRHSAEYRHHIRYSHRSS